MPLYSYVVRWDHGFAPNPFYGVCTLATCKPGIRKGANLGTWIVGTGPSGRGYQDRAIFLMKVEEITDFDRYWHDPRFAAKRPVLNGSYKVRFGDNIYHRDVSSDAWLQADSRHSRHGAETNAINLARDTGTTDKVLLSTDFIYWGGAAPKIPAKFRNFHIGRPGYEYRYSEAEVTDFVGWARSLGQSGRVGDPLEWKFARWWK